VARAVTVDRRDLRDNQRMTNDFETDRSHVQRLATTAGKAEVDAYLRGMHVKYHAQPRQHVRVHSTWMRIELARRSYGRALFHAFAGYVVAGPASLVQRYTGLVVPAFDAKR
jgi:hypothetical protein